MHSLTYLSHNLIKWCLALFGLVVGDKVFILIFHSETHRNFKANFISLILGFPLTSYFKSKTKGGSIFSLVSGSNSCCVCVCFLFLCILIASIA